MNSVLRKEYRILPSVCDAGGRLGIPQIFDIFMDLAAENAAALGSGVSAMLARGLYWIAVKTRARFLRRPEIMERVTVSTWPEEPGRLKNNRQYRVSAGDETLVTGRAEWTIADTRGGGLHSPRDGIYPDGVEFSADRADAEPFHRFNGGAAWEPFGSYTVRSTDIDLGRHMNNAAYVRMLAGLFSVSDWDALALREAEVHYRAPCFEGDTLTLERRDAEGAVELRASAGERTILLARLLSRSES